MSKPFAFALRTRIATWAMRKAKAFAVRVAPWLGRPGDVPMSVLAIVIIVMLIALVVLNAVHGGQVLYRAVLPSAQRQETAP